jgi:polar amino acid transport system substrate-binding protein
MNKRFLQLLALLLAIGLVAGACGDDSDAGAAPTDDDAPADLGLVSDGTLTLCTDSPYPPMEFELDGEFTGFDIELVRAIAGELGLDLSVVNSGFDPITSGLAMTAGDCDLAAASITITEEREANIDFSEPYFSGDQSLLVALASDKTDLAAFNGANLGVQSSTTGEIYANENATGATIIGYENPGDLLTALAAGEVDGVLQDIVVNGEAALNDDTLTIAETYPTDEFYGLAVKEEGSEALLAAVNAALVTLQDDGTYDEIYDTWF